MSGATSNGGVSGWPWAAAIAMLLAAAALATAAAGPAEASPFDGNGVWVWYVASSGGSPEAIARKADRKGISTVYVKSSDGTSYWSQFTRDLVRTLHSRGIEACAWSFVYGNDPKREARLSGRAVARGADCLVIDAESSYEGRYRQAYLYVRKLRRLVGRRYPIGLSSFPYVDYHPDLPYSVFMGRGAAQANLPQIYWHAIGTSVRAAFAHTYRWNRGYGRPLYPIGQTWQDPGKRQILNFRKYAREYGADGVSWWSWQETNSREWRQISRPLRRGIPGFEAEREYAHLRRGDSGDLVLYAQELLAAWDLTAGRDGVFRRRTKRAVSRFQTERGLTPTGRIGDTTWRALSKRKPRSTNWKRRAVPRALSSAATAAAPSSPPGPGGALPPTRGRP